MCGALLQSPIAINTSLSVPIQLAPLAIKQTGITNVAQLLNTGANLQFVSYSVNATLTGAKYPGRTFILNDAHFHWGQGHAVAALYLDSQLILATTGPNGASEHVINGVTYAAELHLEFHDSQYPDAATALQYPDATLYVAVPLRLSTSNNSNLNAIINAAAKAVAGGAFFTNATAAVGQFDLNGLLAPALAGTLYDFYPFASILYIQNNY